ncbi:WXG100 family type VII secretion target [Gordonia sp. ABSL1-1]|uniref:WXG100 family type VII secretion target n=1 Tax=Gordonia sp. ABSL1-1 TaxID=3053923 RepID=UPI0025746D38|nr:WXG100 family type VII secretion target [Gordonia sp. ABSL1-1]MDL9937754.1 WXG100 family type VII secretion target [Gordonia sp. ABSL1-1]
MGDVQESSFKVSPAEAAKKLVEVQAHRDDAKKALTDLRDSQQSLTSGSWQGSSASAHLETTNVNDEEYNNIIQLLDRTVEAAEAGIKKALQADGHQ